MDYVWQILHQVLVPITCLPVGEYLAYLEHPVVLVLVALIVRKLIKLKRFLPAAGLWSVVGYRFVFSLMPDKTEDHFRDLEMLRGQGTNEG
ncbi:MAG: hypothetical protein HQK59_05245, partial [Deltaproteobacteria bacterium]|nr:hypothetical protein [Deltaproteobacteria bacterium]